MNDVKIIFEDDSLLVLDKPAGLVVHTDRRTQESSLSDWLKVNYPELENIGQPHMLDNGRTEPRFGMLHRLDRDTAGVLLVAKDKMTFDHLHAQFLNNQVEKEYEAVVEGDLRSALQGLLSLGKIEVVEGGVGVYKISAPIGRSRIDPRKWTSKEDVRNTTREAITYFSLAGLIPLQKERESERFQTVVQVFPKTGRTHQIRVHFDYLGFPLVGDNLYGQNAENNKANGVKIRLIAKRITLMYLNNKVSFASDFNL